MAKQTKKKRGRGWHGDPAGHAQAGQKGGQITAQSYGQKFFQDIGRQGGRVSPGNFKNDPERAKEAGRKGGESSRMS